MKTLKKAFATVILSKEWISPVLVLSVANSIFALLYFLFSNAYKDISIEQPLLWMWAIITLITFFVVAIFTLAVIVTTLVFLSESMSEKVKKWK